MSKDNEMIGNPYAGAAYGCAMIAGVIVLMGILALLERLLCG